MIDTTFTPGTVITSDWLNGVNDRVVKVLALSSFLGADPTGSTNSDAAIALAIIAATSLSAPILVDGWFRHGSQVVVPPKIRFVGTGWTSDATTRSKSAFIKDFNGVGFLFSGDDASSSGVQYDSIVGRSGDALQVTGSRVLLSNGASTNTGGNGIRIGATEAGASSINANAGSLINWQMLNCGGYGLSFNHTNTTTGATFPLGSPDCNAWTVSHVVIGATGQPCVAGGLYLGNTIDNVFVNVVIQNNTGPAIKATNGARGNVISAYCEGNGSGPVFDVGAKYNKLTLTNTLITGNDAVDNDGTNVITRALSTTNGFADSITQTANLATGGVAEHTFWVDNSIIPAVSLKANQSTGTRGRFALQTKTNGGVRIDRFSVDGEVRGVFHNLSEGVLFNKAQADTTTPGVNILGSGGRIDTVNSGTSATVVAAYYNGNGQVGRVETNGTTTSYITSSDKRLKTNLTPLPDQGTFFDTVKVYEGEFISSPGVRSPMFLAQELYEVAPEAVSVGDDEKSWGVDESKLVRRLVREIQSLRERVASLEKASGE